MRCRNVSTLEPFMLQAALIWFFSLLLQRIIPCVIFNPAFDAIDMRTKIRSYWLTLASLCSTVCWRSLCWAQAPAYTDGELTATDNLYFMITSGFGALVIVVCGMGGFASLIMMRQGKGGKNVSIWGVGMLLVAAFLFVYRVLIKSGFLGQEYLEF